MCALRMCEKVRVCRRPDVRDPASTLDMVDMCKTQPTEKMERVLNYSPKCECVHMTCGRSKFMMFTSYFISHAHVYILEKEVMISSMHRYDVQ